MTLRPGTVRERLVHEYAAVDYEVVHDKLRHLEDLVEFAAAIDAWLVSESF